MILQLSKVLSYFDIKLLKRYRIFFVYIPFVIVFNVNVNKHNLEGRI